MDADSLLKRYALHTRAAGYSPKTIAHVRRSVSDFAKFLAGVPDVSSVTADDLVEYVNDALSRPRWEGQAQEQEGKLLSQTSVNTYVRGIKQCWSWLKAQDVIAENPLAAVKAPKLPQRLPKTLSPEEVAAVAKACRSSRDEAIILLLLDTGMRLAELANLQVADRDEKEQRVHVIGKGNKERVVYMSGWTAAVLSTYVCFERPGGTDAGPLFQTQGGYPLTAARIQKVLERVGKKAGLRHRLGPHRLRHTYATESLKHGASLEHVRRTLGHTDIKTTEIYLSLTDQDIQQAHKSFSPVANLGLAPRRKQRP
ncbi:MAG: tyrosine-type recombinase/integrase [Dehalococcoidia bacterium]|jgi:site-specific recombinase XerD|nr:tyrosine-type recombinase/integrase [Dehalococcoidia bacterium]